MRNKLLTSLLCGAVALSITQYAAQAATSGESVFLLQLGSFQSEDQATLKWDSLREMYPNLFAGIGVSISQVSLPPDGHRVYRTQAGPYRARAQADNVCAKLRTEQMECLVVETIMYSDAAPAAPVAEAPRELITAAKTPPAPAQAASHLPPEALPWLNDVNNIQTASAAQLQPNAGEASAAAVTPAAAPAPVPAAPVEEAKKPAEKPVPAPTASTAVSAPAAVAAIPTPAPAPAVIKPAAAEPVAAKPAAMKAVQIAKPSAAEPVVLAPVPAHKPTPPTPIALPAEPPAPAPVTADATQPSSTVQQIFEGADADAKPLSDAQLATGRRVPALNQEKYQPPGMTPAPAPIAVNTTDLTAPPPEPAMPAQPDTTAAVAPPPVTLNAPPAPITLIEPPAEQPQAETVTAAPAEAPQPMMLVDAPAPSPAAAAAPTPTMPLLEEQVKAQIHVSEAVQVPVTDNEVTDHTQVAAPVTQITVTPPVVARKPLGHLGRPGKGSRDATLWAQLYYFNGDLAAREFWDNFSANHPEESNGLRARITRPFVAYNRTPRISLEVGPFTSADAAQGLCELAVDNKMRCSINRILPTAARVPTSRSRGGMRTGSDSMHWILLGTFKSLPAAEAQWDALEGSHGDILSRLEQNIITPPYSSQPEPVFRLRAGPFVSRARAMEQCGQLQNRQVSCIVVTGG